MIEFIAYTIGFDSQNLKQPDEDLNIYQHSKGEKGLQKQMTYRVPVGCNIEVGNLTDSLGTLFKLLDIQDTKTSAVVGLVCEVVTVDKTSTRKTI